MSDLEYMDIAVEISKKAQFPYGAIVVKEDKIIGRSDDDTLINKGMFTHAELSAIESASKYNNLYGELKEQLFIRHANLAWCVWEQSYMNNLIDW